MAEIAPGLPVGRVGRIEGGELDGLFIEIDDDTQRPKGTGGWYVLMWGEARAGYDDWYEHDEDVAYAFAEGSYGSVTWLSEAASATTAGRHRHGQSDG